MIGKNKLNGLQTVDHSRKEKENLEHEQQSTQEANPRSGEQDEVSLDMEMCPYSPGQGCLYAIVFEWLYRRTVVIERE
jgi:hypothetical protein